MVFSVEKNNNNTFFFKMMMMRRRRRGRIKGGNMFTRELSGITLINGGEGESD